MQFYSDQIGHTIELKHPPRRIISLVPSQTELLVDLGFEDRLVGITKFCVHPKGLRKKKAIVGGTKKLHLDKIIALNPDLIIGNKEENEEGSIKALTKEYPVWISDIGGLDDAYTMITQLGNMLEVDGKAKVLVEKIKSAMDRPRPVLGTAVYLIWQDPIMVAGSDTFINQMMEKAGFTNLVSQSRYPTMALEDIMNLRPDYLLLSSEPYPFKENHLNFFESVFTGSKVRILDGEMFSWYGSRLVHAGAYFDRLGNL